MRIQNNAQSLTNLTPATLCSLEGIPVEHKLLALPGVQQVLSSFDEVLLAGDNPDEETVDVGEQCRITPDTEHRVVVMADHIVVGGLAYDTDAEHCNPLEEGTGNGQIHHYRDHGQEERNKFFKAMGLDHDGNHDLNTEAVIKSFCGIALSRVLANLSLFMRLLNACKAAGMPMKKTSVVQVITDAIQRGGWQDGLHYVAEALYGAAYWTRLPTDTQEALSALEEIFCESVAEEAWSLVENKAFSLSIPLDIYSHGGDSYSISGEGMNCRWDSSRAAAVWVPCQDAIDNIRSAAIAELNSSAKVQWFGACGSPTDPLHARYSIDGGVTWIGDGYAWNWKQATDAMLVNLPEVDRQSLEKLMASEAKNYCRSILEEWNAWISGDVHGVLVYVIDRHTGERIEDQDDECWGFIQQAYAEEELDSAILDKVVSLGASLH